MTSTPPRLSRQLRFGAGALALLGGLGGLFPAVLLNLGHFSPALLFAYLFLTFLSSAGVVLLALWAGVQNGMLAYACSMMMVGTLNGAFSAGLQGLLGGESEYAIVMAMVGGVVGFVLALVYAVVFAPGLVGLRQVVSRPTRHDGIWITYVVGLTWIGGGLLLEMGDVARWQLTFDQGMPSALPLGVVLTGGILFVLSVWRRGRLGRVAAGEHPAFARVSAASLEENFDDLPRLHPWVSKDAAHVLLRVQIHHRGPYRAGTAGEPYARVD